MEKKHTQRIIYLFCKVGFGICHILLTLNGADKVEYLLFFSIL